ncbi:hypothetical protein OAN96_01540 [Candidatus Gracilibacteria bacterium]|nr:hypothetical protein [Candidatus Gracilibacteria bacterium]
MVNKENNMDYLVLGIIAFLLLLGGIYFYYANNININGNYVESTNSGQPQNVGIIERSGLKNKTVVDSGYIEKSNQAIQSLNKTLLDKDEKIQELENKIANMQLKDVYNNPQEIKIVKDMIASPEYGDLSNEPIISFSFLNDTGKIIKRAYLNVILIGNDGKKLLSEQLEYDLYPGMLPGDRKNISQNLSFKWTSPALESTLGISSITQANIIVEVNKLKDIEEQTYRVYNISNERRTEIKKAYTQNQAINSEIRSYKEQINSNRLDQGTVDAFEKEIELLVDQSNQLDEYGLLSMEYYDLTQSEVAESMLISNIQVVAESKK